MPGNADVEVAFRCWAAASGLTLRIDLDAEPLDRNVLYRIRVLSRYSPEAWRHYDIDKPKVAAAQIKGLATRLQGVAEYLATLNERAAHALIMSGLGAQEYDSDLDRLLLKMRRYERCTAEALAKVEAEIAAAADKPRQVRVHKRREWDIACATYRLYEVATGRKPTTRVRDGTRSGPFIDLLTATFAALGVETSRPPCNAPPGNPFASAGAIAAAVVAVMQKNTAVRAKK